MPLTTNWGARFWKSLFGVSVSDEGLGLLDKSLGWANGLWSALSFVSASALWDSFSGEVAQEYREKVPALGKLLEFQLETVTGLDIPAGAIQQAIDGTVGADEQLSLGKIFGDPFLAIFDVADVARGYHDRNPGDAQEKNLKRFMGANLRLQVGGLALNAVGSTLPLNLPNAVHDIPEKVDRILGWEDLMEEMIQEPMQKLVSTGLEAKYLRLTKPIDFTFTEAIQGFHAGKITHEILTKILDNLGYRDDIREHLIKTYEADFTESDIKKLWGMKRLTEAQLLEHYRMKGYGETRARLKADLIMEGDTDDVLDKIDQAYLNLYRDCVISRLELESWLTQRGWVQAKINSHIALEELERRQRKWLSDGDLNKAIDTGLLKTDEVYDYLTCQGMTGVDATIQTLIFLTEKLPRSCWDGISAGDISGMLRAILALLLSGGGVSIPSGLIELLRCLGVEDIFRVEPPPGTEVPEAPRLPTGSFNALPSSPDQGEQFRLIWNISRADTVVIDNGIGTVGPQGTLFLTAAVNTIWKLTATNEDGVRTFQASILVKPAPPPRPIVFPRPGVRFSVSPSSVVEGEQYVIAWETTDATQAFLDIGEGQKPVARNGAQFRVADRSRVFTLTVSGSGGQASRSDTLLVRAAPPERIPAPHASLSISPGQATVGEQVEVRWSTSNAETVTLEGLAGTETVSPVGVRIFTADRDRIVTLHARAANQEGMATARDALIVTAAVPPPEADRPEPTLSFTIRPGRAKRGDVVALEWRASHATTVTLQRASGPVALDDVGATTIIADVTETFILHAVGPGGERAIAKVLIVG